MQVSMAKSEIPSIVVHPGVGGCGGGSVTEGAMSERPRLAKQEEFDMEEEIFLAASPITIHIQGESRDNYGERLEESSLCDEDQPDLPLSAVESSEGGSDTDCKTAEKNVPRSHGHSKGASKLGKQGSSQGSLEGSSPSLSRDSSTETYTDSTGIDLQQFIVDTLHKSQKDRAMLLKIEQDLYTLVKDNKCQVFKFTPMSSYNRMLVHRVAAFFGMEHNIDKPGTSVIVNKTKNTRLPDVRFSEYIRDELVPEEPKKLILKRDSASFEEGKESPERQSSLDSRRSKSFEEREEEYEKARARIFNQDEGYGESPYSLRSQEGTLSSSRRSSQEDLRAWTGEPRPWSSTDSDSSSRKANSFEMESVPAASNSAPTTKNSESSSKAPSEIVKEGSNSSNGLLHPNQLLINCEGIASGETRPSLTKASSFGGITLLTRGDNNSSGGGKGLNPNPARLIKAESLNESSLSSRSQPSSLHHQVAPLQVLPGQSPPSQDIEHKIPVAPAQALTPSQHQQLSRDSYPVTYQLGTTMHTPVSDNISSQPCQWEFQGVMKEEVLPGVSTAVSQGTTSVPVNTGTTLWPLTSVDSIPPGSVLLNPTLSGTPYFGSSESMLYQSKNMNSTQAYVVTPIHTLKGPLLPLPPSAAGTSGKLLLSPSGGAPHQPNPTQLSGFPGSQYGAVVYIPCIASQVSPGTLMGQQGSAASPSSATLQLITAQQQQQPQAVEHRPNQAVMPDLVQQLTALTLTPPPQPAAPPPPTPVSASCEMTSYLVPAISGDLVGKVQTSTTNSAIKQQSTALTAQVPLYYMPQCSTGVFNGVRYICPSGPPMILQGQPPNGSGGNTAYCIKSPEAAPSETHVIQSPSPHLVGQPQQVYPSYSFLGFSQQGVEGGHLNQTANAATLPYNFSAASAGNGPSPTISLAAPTPSIPMYHYTNGNSVLINGAIHNSSQQPQQPQTQQQFYSQPSPVCLVGNNGTSYPQAQYRHLAPGVMQGVNGGPAGTAPYLSYTIYSPQNSNYSSTLHSSFLQVLRPNTPTAVRNPTPPSPSLIQPQQQTFQGVPVQFATAPNHAVTSAISASNFQLPRGKVLIPAKQDLNSKESLHSTGPDMKYNRGAPQLLFSTTAPSLRMPPASSIYRQPMPLLPDIRLLGRPLHQPQQLNPALLLAQQQHQQRPRFTSHHSFQNQHHQYSMGPGMQHMGGPRGGPGSGRGGGGRKGRNRAPTQKGASLPSPDIGQSPLDLLNRGSPLVLEVEGLPQNLRRSELELYLENLVTNFRAKIQVCSGSGGVDPNLQGVDCLLNTPCKQRVLAVFETETAAQSALLNIKTPKFQLRSCAHSKHSKS